MSRFVSVNGMYVNVETIKELCPPLRVGERGKIYFKDGAYTTASSYECDRIIGADHIIQVFPCPKNIVAIYNCNGEICEEDVYFLGLCADGEIKPISLSNGYFDLIDVNNFEGLYPKEETWRVSDREQWGDITEYLCFKLKEQKKEQNHDRDNN